MNIPLNQPPDPELTWSLMHPTRLDEAYMRRVVSMAERYHVDSFEICGDCHSLDQGMDGVIPFDAYPRVAAERDQDRCRAHAQRLCRIVDMAHTIARPVYYWHREITVPSGLIESVPALIDDRGEFDLLGGAFADLLRHKIDAFFTAVPGMDGLVLTLTESEYSVIHTSNTERYPPAQVVAHMARIFAERLRAHGKRFILRSFGSIPEDYEDILAGATSLAGAFSFDVETKITPYDFSPFLGTNPWLRLIPGLTLSAEFDTLGEFLGAGRLPAPSVERLVADVAAARSSGAGRLAVRIDRYGRSILDSVYGVNAWAITRAVRDPGATADTIWAEWAAEHWPEAQKEMIDLMRQGMEAVKKTHFIDGHVLFHVNPPSPLIKWLKAAGIFSVFHSGAPLSGQIRNWGILHEKKAPSHAAILQEKDDAVALAEHAMGRLNALRARLPAGEYDRASELFSNAAAAARLVRELCRCIRAYFDDMDAGRNATPALIQAVGDARGEFGRFLDDAELEAFDAGDDQRFLASLRAQVHSSDPEAGMAEAYARPLWALIQTLILEYRVEYAARREWARLPGVVDHVVCGGLLDEWRMEKAMHACHADLYHGRPVRIVGNRIFPNGWLTCRLRRPAGPARLVIRGAADQSDGFRLHLDTIAQEVRYPSADGLVRMDLPVAKSPRVLAIRIEKSGERYPWIHGMAVLAG